MEDYNLFDDERQWMIIQNQIAQTDLCIIGMVFTTFLFILRIGKTFLNEEQIQCLLRYQMQIILMAFVQWSYASYLSMARTTDDVDLIDRVPATIGISERPTTASLPTENISNSDIIPKQPKRSIAAVLGIVVDKLTKIHSVPSSIDLNLMSESNTPPEGKKKKRHRPKWLKRLVDRVEKFSCNKIEDLIDVMAAMRH